MPKKKSENPDRTPQARAEILEKQRRMARRKLKQPIKERGKDRFQGELDWKFTMTAVLSVAGFTPGQIGAALGEHRNTIKNWQAREDFKRVYHKTTLTLTQSALSLLQTYTIEAVQSLIVVMRTTENEDTIVKVAGEILDRGGLPKMSRAEAINMTPPEVSAVENESFEESFRKMSPEKQEMYLKAREDLDKMMTEVEEPDGDA